MKKILISIVFVSVISCTALETAKLTLSNQSPKGLSISNITKRLDSKAYQTAEKHCAKYNKVPRIVKSTKTSKSYQEALRTTYYECLRPSN